MNKEKNMALPQSEQMLLEAIKAAVRNERTAWPEPVSDEDLTALFSLAQAQKLLPAVFTAVCGCESVRKYAGYDALKKQTARQIALQAQKTVDFLTLFDAMKAAGFHPLVVKGLVCRSLWPTPDLRISSDEDLLIPEEEFLPCCGWLQDCGLYPISAYTEQDFEVGWRSKSSPVFIELHRTFFAPDSGALRDLNLFFSDAHQNAELCPTENGVQLPSLCPREHLLYCLLHAYKHFIHSGFGLRQVCDIGLLARQYAEKIDWQQLYSDCEQAGILLFAAAVFQIARREFEIRWDLPEVWTAITADHQPMLRDLITGGVYGSSDPSRLHSACVTLHTAEAGRSGILHAVFPPKKNLTGRYPVLNRHPALLPFIWVDRLAKYGSECVKGRAGSVRGSLQIAAQREALLRQYGLLP